MIKTFRADGVDGHCASMKQEEPQAFNKRVKLFCLGVGTEEGQFRTGIKEPQTHFETRA